MNSFNPAKTGLRNSKNKRKIANIKTIGAIPIMPVIVDGCARYLKKFAISSPVKVHILVDRYGIS